MFEFECWHENADGDKWCPQRYIAETSSKAKSQHYQYLQDGLWEDDFFTVVKGMRCRKIGRASIACLFGDYEQFERIKEHRGIDFAFQGMRIQVDGKMGTIVGGNSSQNIDVVFDGFWWKDNCHPWYETVYFDNKGNILADYRAKAVNQ